MSFCIAVMTSCNKAENTPHCVQDKISTFNENAMCENGARVDEYMFQRQIVYVFRNGNCGADMTSEVIDDHCITLGYLGGMDGNTSINGEEFSKAKLRKTIWER